MKRMKDFTLDSFQFGLMEKSENEFKFKLISEHNNLKTEVNDKGAILALIDLDSVLLKNHIIKKTRNGYLYFISNIDILQEGVFLKMLRKHFEPEEISKYSYSLKRALERYSKVDISRIENEESIPIGRTLGRSNTYTPLRSLTSAPLAYPRIEDDVEDDSHFIHINDSERVALGNSIVISVNDYLEVIENSATEEARIGGIAALDYFLSVSIVNATSSSALRALMRIRNELTEYRNAQMFDADTLHPDNNGARNIPINWNPSSFTYQSISSSWTLDSTRVSPVNPEPVVQEAGENSEISD